MKIVGNSHFHANIYAKALIVDFSNKPPPLIIITTALTNRKTVSFNSAPLYLGALRRRLYFNAAARHRGRLALKKDVCWAKKQVRSELGLKTSFFPI